MNTMKYRNNMNRITNNQCNNIRSSMTVTRLDKSIIAIAVIIEHMKDSKKRITMTMHRVRNSINRKLGVVKILHNREIIIIIQQVSF